MAEGRSDVTSENLSEQADKMRIPADVNSVSAWITSMIECLQALPHVRELKEPVQAISDLQILLLEQGGKPCTAQEASGLQDILLNDSRLTAKWKRLRLLFEPSTFAEKLRSTFREISDSFNKLQVPSKDNIVEQLDKVILDLSDGGDLIIKLNRAETEFKKQFWEFLRENLSKPATSDGVSSVCIWLANQLGTDVDLVRQELEEVKENGGTLIEGLVMYVTELEERKCTIELVAEPSGEGGESSDASFEGEAFRQPLDVIARNGVEALKLTRMARVLQGFVNLIKCTKLPGGKYEVYRAGAVEEAIRLAKTEDGQYIKQAVKLLEALTSSRGGVALESERDEIYIEVSDHMEVLIELMKAKRHPEARLLAAETVVNILVNQSVWHTVRSQYDIVSALVSISNQHPVDRNIHDRNQADRVCLLGLTRLTIIGGVSTGRNLKLYSTGDKTQIIVVTVLMKLLREGLMDDGEANLAKDSLVALDTQVLVMDHSTQTDEVCLLIRKQMSELMVIGAFDFHSSVPGRMAVVSIMTKLCGLYEEDITEDLFSYLLKLIKKTGDEILKVLGTGKEQVEDLTELQNISVKLLCFSVTYGNNTAQSVLSKNAEERATLEKMLDEQDAGISIESRLEIMNILDQIDKLSSPPTTDSSAGQRIAKLVKMLNSSAPAYRPQVASRILQCVKEYRDEKDAIEMKKAGVVDALMGLLEEENEHCQQDALLALYALSSHIAIQTGQLPRQTILAFLSTTESEVRDAAVRLLNLMVEENVVDAKKFMETPGALKNTLVTLKIWLDESLECSESASSQNCASALLKLATENGNDSVRLGILNDDLSILVKYVQKCQNVKFKELLTTTLNLICKNGKGSDQEVVTEGGGHIFLLTSLRGNIMKERAAQGLLSLIYNKRTRDDVLQAGFVAIAVESINQEFASTDIALGLADICSTKEGIAQIHVNKKSVQALLVLLEHCPKLEGKGSAAAVIAKLYPRLNRTEDSLRQIEMIEACPHLVRYLELDDKYQLKWFPDDKSQLLWFLKALAAIATGKKGRLMIYESRGQIPLINYLKNREIDNQVQDMMLKILAEMSYVFTEGSEKRDSTYHKILNQFLEHKISELLCLLPMTEAFKKNTESMKRVLILIRNFSLAGRSAIIQLLEQRAVDLVLKVLKQHEHEPTLSNVTELAVKALEKFMDEPNGKQAFLKGGGIHSLVVVLKLSQIPRGSDVKEFTTVILTSVSKDPITRKQACETIFSCNILRQLNTIMFEGETSKIRWQAAVLMRLMAMYGPTSRVCSAMKTEGCLDALNQLKDVIHCKEIANDVLKFVSEKSKSCKKEIDSWSNPR